MFLSESSIRERLAKDSLRIDPPARKPTRLVCNRSTSRDALLAPAFAERIAANLERDVVIDDLLRETVSPKRCRSKRSS